MLEKLTPGEYYDSIFDIEASYLKEIGIKGIIIDLDNTLIPRNTTQTTERLTDWLLDIKKKGLKVVIVSNNKKHRCLTIASKLDLPVIALAKKPFKNAFSKGLEVLKTTISETAVIGDQIFTDVFGANRMGLHSILVVPMSNSDLMTTKLIRKFERMVLRRLEKYRLIPKDERKIAAKRAH